MRQDIGKLNPPYILYLPLILKGNTDTADGKLMHFITATFHLSHWLKPLHKHICLLLTDLTFIHEGNKSYRNGLVYFEKMVSGK